MKKPKILVAYYSRTGTTKKVAQEIAKKLGCDSEEILDTVNRAGVIGYMRSGRDASMKKQTKLKKIKKDPADYDLVIVGTPIWSWTVTPPARTYLAENKKAFKKVAFFCTQGGSGSEKAFAEMAKECGKRPKATLVLLTKEVQAGGYDGRIAEFLKKL